MARSPTAEFALAPGPPTTAALEGPSAAATAATVSNGPDAGQRGILKQAAVQLRDALGNAVAVAGVRLKWRLKVADGAAAAGGDAAAGGAGGGGEAPELECEGGGLEAETDETGRAFFGDMMVVAGTGRVVSGGAVGVSVALSIYGLCMHVRVSLSTPQIVDVSSLSQEPGAACAGLDCELTLGVKFPPAAAGGKRSSGWMAAWKCGVLFTDDAARAAALMVGFWFWATYPQFGRCYLESRGDRRSPNRPRRSPTAPNRPQALQSERDALQQRLASLRERLKDAVRRADGSRKEAKAAARTGALVLLIPQQPPRIPSSNDPTTLSQTTSHSSNQPPQPTAAPSSSA
jgi:hypothetical protein